MGHTHPGIVRWITTCLQEHRKEEAMKRCAACIRMLQLLRSRGFMTREQLAAELDTNVRNILEYRKELEEAGYVIEGTTGKYGGYQLKSGSLLPVAGLYEEELRALQESRRYLESHRDFLPYPAFCRGIDKFLATTTLQVRESGVYVEENADVSKAMKSMIHICEQARDASLSVELQYKSLHAESFETIVIHPYEIINVKGSYYCLAYSLKARDYRNFKFSEERMRNVQLTRRRFVRDADFHIHDYIGKTGLMKDEVIELKLYVYGESARLISEKKPGISPVMEWVDEQTLYLVTIMEGRISARNFLLSLGNQCRLLAPQDLKQEIQAIAKDMLSLYS